MDHRVQAKRSDQRHVLSDTMQSQFQNAVGGISYQLDGHGGKPTTRASLTIWRARIPTVLCRVPNFSLTSGVVARTHRKGKAQRGFVQGNVTTTAMTIQRKPGLLTERSRLERALSR